VSLPEIPQRPAHALLAVRWMAILRRLNKPVYALAIVAAIAGGVRFYGLATPNERVFDEVYYSKDGCLYAGYSWKECAIKSSDEKYWVRERDEVGSWVHPPMGKWMIAIGERLFGPNAFGWRFSAAVFGTATVVFTAAIALLLLKSALWTFVTGLLAATENLSFVQSRVALLDIFLAFWVVLGFFFLILDRRWIHIRTVADREKRKESEEEPLSPEPDTPGERPGVPAPLWRPWRFAAGAAFGGACATKWSGAYALAGALILTLLWERTRRSNAGVGHPIGNTALHEAAGVVLALVLLPVVVYLGSYFRFWLEHGIHPSQFWALQNAMEDFHTTLSRVKDNGDLTHPYESQPWTWFFVARPVNFYFKGAGGEILDMGNPAIFWGSIAAIPYVAYSWWKKRDPRCGLLTVAVLTQWLPWFLWWDRVQFIFYMTPIVPFMVLACVYALRDLSDFQFRDSTVRAFRPVAVGLVVLSVGLFTFFWPVLVGYPLNSEWWHARIWFPSWY